MEAVNFKGANVVFAENQDQYNSLPALQFRDDHEGKVITCWKLKFWERLRVLWTGKIWHSQMTFNGSLQPINKTTKRTDFFTYDKKPKDNILKYYVLPFIPIIGLIFHFFDVEILSPGKKRPFIHATALLVQLLSLFVLFIFIMAAILFI